MKNPFPDISQLIEISYLKSIGLLHALCKYSCNLSTYAIFRELGATFWAHYVVRALKVETHTTLLLCFVVLAAPGYWL